MRTPVPGWTGIRWIVAAFVAIVASGGHSAAAQEVARSFGELAPIVKPGTRIRISYEWPTSSGTTEGTLTLLSDDAITILTKSGGTIVFPAREVREIAKPTTFVPWATGTGAAAGAVGTWLFAYLTRDCGACGYGASRALLMGGWIGAAVGIPFDLRRTSRLLYRASGHSPTITIGPTGSPGSRRGLAASAVLSFQF